jgi:hypothetical protein
MTIKRHRRVTKHRKGTTKGTTKPRKSIRRIKNRKLKTRRQSGGGYKSFIRAEENPIAPVADNYNDPALLFQLVKGKGIDVKFKTDKGQRMWLIGGNGFMDATFGELQAGAKEGRYKLFISVLLEKYPYFNNFEDKNRDIRLSKGIILTDEQFCNIFIDKPNGEPAKLNYPELKKRFKERGFECPVSASSAAPSAAVRAPPSRVAPLPYSALSDIGMGGISTAVPPGLYQVQQQQQQPVTTKYITQLNQIKEMNLENATPQQIAQALNDSGGDVNKAVAMLLSSAASEQSVTARGGVVSRTGFGSAPPQQYSPPPGHPPQQYPPQQFSPPNEETIRKMMTNAQGIEINTMQKVKFALEKTKNNVADAIDLLNPPSLNPEQVQAAYRATPDYLKNPEIFVQSYVKQNSIPQLNKSSYPNDPGRSLNAFPQIFHQWRVIQTVGDGNCLTHAFLQCLSPTYGKITGEGYTNKSRVAQAFRLRFSSESGLARDKLEYEIGSGLVDLSDLQILDYSRLFNVITVVFEQVVVNPAEDMANPIIAHNLTTASKPTDTVIFIHADGGHYSSVMLTTGEFTMTLNEARQIQALTHILTT